MAAKVDSISLDKCKILIIKLLMELSLLKINDTFALGGIAGIFGSIPALLFDYLSYSLGFSKYLSVQIAAGVYLYKGNTNSLGGLILGLFVWEMFAGILGVLMVKFMQSTGKDYWWMKGLGANILFFTIIYGFILTLGGGKVVPFDVATNLTVLGENIIFALVTSYMIIRLGNFSIINKS